MVTYAIETAGLSKKFKTTQALKDITLKIAEGDAVAILGPNGAGKTTFLKILSTLTTPDSGHARIFGYDVVTQTDEAKKNLSVAIGEDRSFYWRLTGRQNLEFFAALYNLSATETKAKIEQAAEIFQLNDLDKPYQEYSTGRKSRLALARSFLHDAPLILMDEPTRSLDLVSTDRLWSLIRKTLKAQKKTLIFTTHHLDEVAAMANRVIILSEGSLKLDTSAENFEQLRHAQKLKPYFEIEVST